MNVGLTDHLVCPRCGPPFGLILLAHDVRDRRVLRGEFGCPNCRDRFPVVDGFGDLRPPPRGPGPGDLPGGAGGGDGRTGGVGGESAEARPAGKASRAEGGSADGALRLAAALGVTRGPGLIVVPDACRDEAAGLGELVRDVEVVVVGWGGRGAVGAAVSAFVTGPTLPLRDGVARGVVAAGDAGAPWWDECLRVLMPGGRVVIVGASEAAREWVQGAGMATVLDEGGGAAALLVAVLPLPGAGPRPGRWVGRTRASPPP